MTVYLARPYVSEEFVTIVLAQQFFFQVWTADVLASGKSDMFGLML